MQSLGRNSRSFSFIIQRAKGSWITDINGISYLDAFSSFSSANFGHQHPKLLTAFKKQAKTLSVFSRTSTSDVLLELCEEMYRIYQCQIVGGALRVIPMNSGVEAGETSIKLARKWGYLRKNIPDGQASILFAHNNYWGRTIAAISSSGYSYQRHFYPAVPGFSQVPYNDVPALANHLKGNPNVAAVFLEPIQGEGGINVPADDYFTEVRRLCTQHNVLLITDEIQTGMGRTGPIRSIPSDMVLLGKSLGGGFVPFSACMARSDIADLFLSGEHSSTFGGFPLGARMALESLRLLHDSPLATIALRRETEFSHRLTQLKREFPHYIDAVRGKGMLWGIQLSPMLNAWSVVQSLLRHRIVTREASNNVVRVCPPLTSTDSELDFMFTALREGLLTL